MKKNIVILVVLFFVAFNSFAQKAIVSGKVKDENGAPQAGANVYQNFENAITADEKGMYRLELEPGEVKIIFSSVGFATDTQTLQLKAGEAKTLNMTLRSTAKEIGELTVSVGRVTKKITQESVTVEVFKPRVLEVNNITNVVQAVNKVPGVTVLDGSVSIRGGSGYAYGSGSRVMMVVDEMPLVTPDRGEIRWEFVPMENVKQIEVLKGASSVQYGSAALNGVIQVTTANPTDSPQTKLTYYTEIYGNPPKTNYKWWGGDSVNYLKGPHTNGFTFMHSRKFGNDVGFTIGGNLHESKSHLKDEYDNRARFNTKIKYTPSKFNRLTIGLSANVLLRRQAFQFFWKDIDQPYAPMPGVTITENFLYTMIDPSIYYTDKSNSNHRLLARWYKQYNPWNKDSPRFNQVNVDYQFRHDFGKWAKLIVGVNNIYFNIKDGVLGTRQGNQGGGYFQGEGYYKGITLSFGGRFEYLNLDKATRITQPVFKAGINYKFNKNNFLRFGFGQGYRFGSIAERFVDYKLDILHILPNPTLKPEAGYTLELGYKRQFNIGKNWRGYADACMFWQEFDNMIEFQYQNVRIDSVDGKAYVEFMSTNVTKARILGWEFALNGEGKIGKNLDLSFQGGYTYFYGRDVNDTTYNNTLKTFFADAFRTFIKMDSIDRTRVLKYRQRHQFKFDVDALIYKKFRLGASFNIYSYMDAIEPLFEAFIPGLKKYRTERYGKPDWVLDLRAGYEISKNLSINFMVKNVTNNDYAIRIAKPNAPRLFSIQLNAKF